MPSSVKDALLAKCVQIGFFLKVDSFPSVSECVLTIYI